MEKSSPEIERNPRKPPCIIKWCEIKYGFQIKYEIKYPIKQGRFSMIPSFFSTQKIFEWDPIFFYEMLNNIYQIRNVSIRDIISKFT